MSTHRAANGGQRVAPRDGEPRGASRTTRLVVHGAGGRMGARLCALAHADERFALVAALARAGSRGVGKVAAPAGDRGEAPAITHDLAGISPGCADVVVEFSSDAGVARALDAARRAGAALLVGTTGLTESTSALLREAARERAVLVTPNTSLGVAVVARVAGAIARALGQDWSASIVEAHHEKKKDAPSGTALRLARAIRDHGGRIGDDQVVAIRGGDVIGEHTIRFAGNGEYIELTHRATSRDLFIRGALEAAQWLRGARPGWWTMEDVLGMPA